MPHAVPHALTRIAACIAILSVTTTFAQTRPVAASRPHLRPVPSDTDLAAAKKDLQTRFAKDFEDQSPAGRRRLIDILLKQVPTTPGDAALYALLSTTRELASALGEVETAIQSAESLGDKYNLDPALLHTSTLFDCSKATLTPQNAVTLSAAAKLLTESLIAADDFDGAVKAATLAEECSRRGGDTLLQTDAALLVAYCKDVAKQAPGFKAALTTLQLTPDDAPANQRAGEFLAITKGEWGRALLLLSRGSDPALKSAASAELSGQPSDLLTSANAWSTWAEKQHGPSRLTVQRHALSLYFRAAPNLKDSDLTTCLDAAGKLLAALGPTAELTDPKTVRAALGEPRWLWLQSLKLGTLDYRTDAAKNVNSQALLKWKPKLDSAGEVPPPPESPNQSRSPKSKPLTYRLLTLVTDEAGNKTILEKTGNVTWRSPEKPLGLNGPTNADLKRLNNNRLIPQSAHLTLYLDNIEISQRLYKLPTPPTAWWLDDSKIQRRDR